jgi:hypothetical protein
MFRAESLELLARSRRPRLRDRSIDQDGRQRCRPIVENTVLVDDPDDVIDPDDSGPRLSVTLKQSADATSDKSYGETCALPAAQPEQTSGRCPHTLKQSTALQSPLRATAATVGVPAMPDLLDPVVLRTMPPRVAAFMLYEPREPQRWRTSSPPDGMDDGAWCG